MSLDRITIYNFRSIKKCDLQLSNINTFIGENGAGKTNLIDAVNYFYANLTEDHTSDSCFNTNNKFSNEIRIILTYDLREIRSIAKAQLRSEISLQSERDNRHLNHKSFYGRIVALADECNNRIKLELRQVKGRMIQWNYNYEDRFLIKSLFPVFHLDTRGMDTEKWDDIWNIIGEFSKVSNAERYLIHGKVISLLDTEGESFSSSIHEVKSIMTRAHVNVQSYSPREYAETLSKLFFSGELIKQNQKNLRYYSKGTNSAHYLCFFIQLINSISLKKLKSPIILLDEPEIGLHTKYIDEIAEFITDQNSRTRFIISTHSPRFVRDIIANVCDSFLFSVKLSRKESRFVKMRTRYQCKPNLVSRISDAHIATFFSSAIIVVEGESELELLSNTYIRDLFPVLKKTEVITGMSNGPIQSVVNPDHNKIQVPCIRIVDMDKFLEHNIETNKFRLKTELLGDKKKECLRYRSRHDQVSIFNQRKYIETLADRLRVHYYFPFYSCEDPNHSKLMNEIKKYADYYGIFVFNTTVEGVLITNKNTVYVMDFLRKKHSSKAMNAFQEYWNSLQSLDRINVLRLVFKGKTDLWKKAEKVIPKDKKRIIFDVSMPSKTSGWITEFINGYFGRFTKLDENLTPHSFRRFLENDLNREKILKDFKTCFPELYSLMVKIHVMISMQSVR